MALRAFSLACSIPWAITPESLQQILEISTREHLPDFEAVAAKKARRMDSAEYARIREGGVAALNDPSVSSILLNIDSPGGEVAGVNEFAQMDFDGRSRKPIVAYVDGLGASAAYWIASAAHEIAGDATSMVGSIGVVAAVPNPDKRSAREVEFVSSQSPKKRPNPNTESGKDQIQALVDDLAEVFVGTVARNRGVSAKTVLAEFGQGAVLVGQKAVEAGLADRLGSFEQVVADLAAGKKPRRYKPKMAAEIEKSIEAVEGDMTLSEKFEAMKTRLIDVIKGAAAEEAAEDKSATEATEATEAQAKNAEEDAARIAAAQAENERLRAQIAMQREEKTKADAESFVLFWARRVGRRLRLCPCVDARRFKQGIHCELWAQERTSIYAESPLVLISALRCSVLTDHPLGQALR